MFPYSIPQDRRFKAVAVCTDAALENTRRGEVLMYAARNLASQIIEHVANTCVRSSATYQGFAGNTLELDVYILSPYELHTMMQNAYADGQRAALSSRPYLK